MSLQSECLLNRLLRLRLTHLAHSFRRSPKGLPYPNFGVSTTAKVRTVRRTSGPGRT